MKIAILKLEDKGQDFLEVDIYDNGVISGNSIMFNDDRVSLIGIGTLDGTLYFTFEELKKMEFKVNLENLYLYINKTGDKKPLPWESKTLKYKVVGTEKI
jgi:hypothetical protein